MVNEKTIEELLSELMLKCGMGLIISPVETVSGGFLHRMYRVVTECGTYAVKYLNPVIMGREGVHENFARAEKNDIIRRLWTVLTFATGHFIGPYFGPFFGGISGIPCHFLFGR